MAFCLNVLDRCKDPVRMVSQLHSLLPHGGWLVVSVVLPPLQSDAATWVGSSQRSWGVVGTDFESAAASLIDSLFLPAGFEPLRLVRAPYLCAGDRYSPVAVLDAAVLLLRKAGAGGAQAQADGRGAVAGAGPPRRATSPARPPLPPTAVPAPRTAEHDHIEETRCNDCDALDGYRFGEGAAPPQLAADSD